MGSAEVIVIDTHIWVRLILGTGRLSVAQRQAIADNEEDRIGISAISFWEIAKLAEYGKLDLGYDILEWFRESLTYPGLTILELTPEIAVESTRLPGGFNKDPSDQIIVATAMVHGCSLVTSDRDMIRYPHVTTVS